MPTVTIEPNDKYRSVINGEPPYLDEGESVLDMSEAEYIERNPYHEAENAFVKLTGTAVERDSPHNFPELTWGDVSVPDDTDLLDLMATYFDGVDAEEPADLIRSKLRLCAVERVMNAQIAAQEERKL